MDEQDLERFLKFFEKLEELAEKTDQLPLQYSSGVLSTPGCSGDFGCCAERFDLMGFADDIKDFLDDT